MRTDFFAYIDTDFFAYIDYIPQTRNMQPRR